MDDTAYHAMLAPIVLEERVRSYDDWLKRLNDDATIVHDLVADDGTPCTVEINVCWDDRALRHIRVFLSIAGGNWRSFFPITDSFIIAPDGSFVGE